MRHRIWDIDSHRPCTVFWEWNAHNHHYSDCNRGYLLALSVVIPWKRYPTLESCDFHFTHDYSHLCLYPVVSTMVLSMNSKPNHKRLSTFIVCLRIIIFLTIAIPAGYFSVQLGILSLSSTLITIISIVYLLLLALLLVSLFYQKISTDRKVMFWFLYIGFLTFITLVL